MDWLGEKRVDAVECRREEDSGQQAGEEVTPDQKPPLEYGKQGLPRAPLWVILAMGIASGIGGSLIMGVGFLVIFYRASKYEDTVANALLLCGLGVGGAVATAIGLAVTWGRRYR